MKKYRKQAVQTKKASCIVLSGCIAASMISSASVLGLQKTCVKAESSERLHTASVSKISALPKIAAVSESFETQNTQTLLQTPAALQTPANETAAVDFQMPSDPQTERQTTAVPYQVCDGNGQNWNTKEASNCISIESMIGSNPLVLSDGWYVVDGQITIQGSISVSGDVHLILADGCTLTVGGIQVAENNSLSIYSQSSETGMGELISNAGEEAAGIGGGTGESNGNITIYGGNITANGGVRGAGIGGGYQGNGSNITIYNGTVTANAGEMDSGSDSGGGAGIGGGFGGNGYNITIYNGIINAKGTSSINYATGEAIGQIPTGGGAGIGGGGRKSAEDGSNGNGGNGEGISIYGGTVNATGAASGGAGIGGGNDGAGTDILIEAGTVTATGRGAGIGGGGTLQNNPDNCTGQNITINGGIVNAASSSIRTVTDNNGNLIDVDDGSGAGIGGGDGTGKNITINGGTVTATGGPGGGGAGIGGGADSSAEGITITGGTVTAIGGENDYYGGAGIGGGCLNANTGTVKSIAITGGTVTATGKKGSAAIGGGESMASDEIKISDAIVFVTTDPSNTNPPIGNGSNVNNGGAATVYKNNCVIFDQNKNEGEVSGNFTYDGNIIEECTRVSPNAKLTILDHAKLQLDEGCRLENEGTIINNGELELLSGSILYNTGTIYNNNTLVLGNLNCLQGPGKLEGTGTFLVTVATENLNSEDLSRQYDSQDHAEQIIDSVKSLVENFTYKYDDITFGMRPGNYTDLPSEMKDAGEYPIKCDGGEITFTITKAPLEVVSAVPDGTSKKYDGNEKIKIKHVEITGQYPEDIVSVNTDHLYGSLSSSQVGVYHSVMLRDMELIGDDAGNYSPPADVDAGLVNEETKLEMVFQIISANTSSGSSSSGSYSSYQEPYIPYSSVKQPFLKNNPAVSGWTQIRLHAEKKNTGASIEIEMNETTQMPKEMLQTIKDREICLVLNMGSGIAWEINGQDLVSGSEKNLDLAVSCKTDSIPSDLIAMISSSVAGKPAYRIQMKQVESFGFPVTLAIQTGVKNAGFYANLYLVDKNKNDLEYIRAEQIGSDGTIRLAFTDPDEYVVVLDDKIHKKPEETEDPVQVVYEAQVQSDGNIRITASDGSGVSNMLVTAVDGMMYYTDADGMAVRNQIVKADGKKYFAKETGAIATNEFCRTPKGSLIYAQADSTLAAYRVITVNGRKYYAKGNCAIARSGFFVTQKGSLIYARSSGEMVTDQIFSVKGSFYYAKPSGALARNGFYKTKSGDKIYAGSAGKLMTGKLFRVNGKMYYADKKARVIKDRWVTVSGKKYYCSSSYRITKTKK